MLLTESHLFFIQLTTWCLNNILPQYISKTHTYKVFFVHTWGGMTQPPRRVYKCMKTVRSENQKGYVRCKWKWQRGQRASKDMYTIECRSMLLQEKKIFLKRTVFFFSCVHYTTPWSVWPAQVKFIQGICVVLTACVSTDSGLHFLLRPNSWQMLQVYCPPCTLFVETCFFP